MKGRLLATTTRERTGKSPGTFEVVPLQERVERHLEVGAYEHGRGRGVEMERSHGRHRDCTTVREDGRQQAIEELGRRLSTFSGQSEATARRFLWRVVCGDQKRTSDHLADSLCLALGYHPIEVYGLEAWSK